MTQDINTTEARELFAKTTQGKWHKDLNPYVLISSRGELVLSSTSSDTSCGKAESDIEFCQYAHNNWQAMLKTIERQAKELGEYWRAACDVESVDDAVSAKGLSDLHDIRTGNNYSQVGPSVAEMLMKQRDELAKEVERLKNFEKCVTDAMQWEPNEFKRLIDQAILELRIKRGEVID